MNLEFKHLDCYCACPITTIGKDSFRDKNEKLCPCSCHNPLPKGKLEFRAGGKLI